MRVLITGGSGLLGKYLLLTQPEDYTVWGTWYTNFQSPLFYQLNVTNLANVQHIFDRIKPNVIIHCAAIGSVDYAERNYQETIKVNVEGTKNIIKVAGEYRAKLVYISTNAVYRGNNPPYDEKSELNPVNAYGRIKKQAERAVKDSQLDWLIVRPYLLYGWPFPGGRGNWVTTIIDRLSNGKSLKLVNDVHWMLTYAGDCAKAIWRLIELDNNEEIYNISSWNSTSLYELGLETAKVFNLNHKLLKGVPSDTFPNIAPRPIDTSYDLGKIEKLNIKLHGLKKGLKMMKKELNV